MSTSILGLAWPTPFSNRPLRNKACRPLCPLPTSLGNPSQWTTCWVFLQPSREMTVFFWLLINFPRWRLRLLARRASQWRPLPRYSSNECGYIFGYHKPLSHIGTFSSLAHSGRASGHGWTPSSPNTMPSTPKQIAKLRSSIG
jgi:hypothetical protein